MTAVELFTVLEKRFKEHPMRHPDQTWEDVRACLEQAGESKIRSLLWMEQTGGEPDVLRTEPAKNGCFFVDFSPESPSGRRSLCYDREAWLSRKANRPETSAAHLAEEYGVTLLDEEIYREIAAREPLDQKTSSWLLTPPEVRSLGGAIFGDYRYGRVFIYHNGADSYYGVRGFRALCEI